jgi:hypothetical protein
VFQKHTRLPELPRDVSHIWEAFVELFNPEGVGNGPFRIHFAEIEAYARLTRKTLSPGEAIMIRDLSEVYVKHYAATKGKPQMTNVTSMSDVEGIKRKFLSAGSDRPKTKTRPKTPEQSR